MASRRFFIQKSEVQELQEFRSSGVPEGAKEFRGEGYSAVSESFTI
jgi:hypothetical protein